MLEIKLMIYLNILNFNAPVDYPWYNNCAMDYLWTSYKRWHNITKIRWLFSAL